MNTHEESLAVRAEQLMNFFDIHPKHYETVKYVTEDLDPEFDRPCIDDLDPEYLIDQHKARLARNKFVKTPELQALRDKEPFNFPSTELKPGISYINYDKVLEAFRYFPGITRKQQTRAIRTVLLDPDYRPFKGALIAHIQRSKGVVLDTDSKDELAKVLVHGRI